MALDDKSLERMLKAQKEALERARPAAAAPQPGPAAPDNSHLFEEFQRPAQPGDKPKPRGLNAAGYQFPPQTGTPAMTKENLAKGLSLPPSQNAVPPLPESKLVESDTLFEEYHRPDLKDKPRTGTGLRSTPPAEQPRSAKEILRDYEPPTPQVFTGKRDAPTFTPLAPAPAPVIRAARPLSASQPTPELDAAHLDAEADLASAPELTMSHSRDHGPSKTVTTHDPLHEMPTLPTPPARPALRSDDAGPHTSDAPAVEPGDGPRLAVVQADFNYAITTRMAEAAITKAKALGCDLHLHVHVAGVFDIPLAAKALASRDDVDAILAIGCVIQGETGHDQLIATECARKLADLSYESEKPVGLAVTGPRMSRSAAEARAESVPVHAAEAVVKQWRALKAIGATRLAAR